MQDILYLNQKLKIANEVKHIKHKCNILTIYSILLTKASAVDSQEHACKKKKKKFTTLLTFKHPEVSLSKSFISSLKISGKDLENLSSISYFGIIFIFLSLTQTKVVLISWL